MKANFLHIEANFLHILNRSKVNKDIQNIKIES
jgi:hypothetical protein